MIPTEVPPDCLDPNKTAPLADAQSILDWVPRFAQLSFNIVASKNSIHYDVIGCEETRWTMYQSRISKMRNRTSWPA